MDLRSVLNAYDNGDRDLGSSGSNGPPTPHLNPQQPPGPASYPNQNSPAPQPSPSPAAQYNREYNQHTPSHAQPLPSSHQQHQQHQQQTASYPPPSPYQAQSPYLGRHVPPLQANNFYQDVRSPSSSRSPVLGQPAYRPNLRSSGPSTGGAGYPFPQTHPPQETVSPSQRPQVPPQPYQHQQPPSQRRDSFSQGGSLAHGSALHVQQPGVVPQTPPVSMSGGSYSYVHQRSQSTQSTPTPTSAQSQYQHVPPYTHGSPGAAPSRATEESRHASQPKTPLGPPSTASTRQGPVPGSFTQPPSPYQHRTSATLGAQTVQQTTCHRSPGPTPPPGSSQRLSSAQTHDYPPTDSHKQVISHQEREHTLSVSPKTRVPSLPSYSDRATPPTAASEIDSRGVPGIHPIPLSAEPAILPAKRKMDDRDMSPQEIQQRVSRHSLQPSPAEVNGTYPKLAEQHGAILPVHKRRKRYSEPPAWAKSVHTLESKIPKSANFVLQKRPRCHVNGKRDNSGNAERISRHPSPETLLGQSGAPNQTPVAADSRPQDILGPWEASITGVKPYEEISKSVADFLFINVLNNEDIQEIMGRGILFEIEAKLGVLIDKDTSFRVERRIDSECILQDNGRTAFRSSMTEAHHKAFNEFLNQIVIETDPRNPAGGGRVQVHYKHRREIDRFFDLSPELLGRIPGCMRARLGQRAKNVRVRVTYDQKTKEVLAKIVKARVADFDLHIPTCPMDCRISVNLEMNWDGSVEELEQSAAGHSDKQADRCKDRLSYSQGHYQIDLTQVTQTVGGSGHSQRPEKEHELEIELAPGVIIDQGRRAMNGAPHRYQELVEGFVDNVRVLARKAKEFPTS